MAVFVEDECYLGTEKKYIIKIESAGFDMEEDEFEVIIKRGSNVLTFTKEDLIQGRDEEENWYVTFNTSDLGAGVASMTVIAHVPDNDFPDGIRDEVDKFNFLRIKSV